MGNARKRRWLAEELDRLKLIPPQTDKTAELDIKTIVQKIITTLAKQNKVILYEQPLQMPEEPARKEGILFEKVTDEIARLLALGKIDINIQLTVKFVGDKRVLDDIKLLVNSGYGEDNHGNNIALPEKIAYLRR